jgi:opacity protein-like surface antigen
MSVFAGRFGLTFVLAAALCLGGRTAHAQAVAQAAPVSYWTPGWPVGFGNLGVGNSNTYGNFPSFDGSDVRGGISRMRYNFGGGWFVGSEGGIAGLNMTGINQLTAFGSAGSLNYQSVQFGYNFQNAPVTVYAGFDTLKYDTNIGSPFAPFDKVSGALPGYSARAGVEFQPTSNLSLSFGVGYTQQSGRVDSDINSSLLPGASPLAVGGRP